MIRLQVGDNFYDVAGDDNFADIPFGTQVQLWRSNQAAAENKVIVKTDIKTKTGTVPYFDLAGYFGGMWFSMPNEDAEVYLYIDTLNLYQFNIVWDQVINGKLVFRKTPNASDPACSLNEFAIGDTVYVWGEPNVGYADLGIGDLKIMSGMNNLATLHKEATASSGPIWKFTLPNNVITLQATFPKEEAATVTLTVIKPLPGQRSTFMSTAIRPIFLATALSRCLRARLCMSSRPPTATASARCSPAAARASSAQPTPCPTI